MKQLSLFLFLIILASCSHRIENVYFDVEALSASRIYNGDSVNSYLQRNKESTTAKEMAEAYVEKGKKEENINPNKAVYYYKRAITLYPGYEAYKILAGALFKLNRYDELWDLHSFLIHPYASHSVGEKYVNEFVFDRPTEDMFYEYLVSSILAHQRSWSYELYDEKENYDLANIKKRLLTDERLKLDTNSVETKHMMLQFVPWQELEAEAKKPSAFTNFIKSIKDTGLVFELDEKSVSKFNYENFISEFDEADINFDAINVYYLKEKQDNKDSWNKFNFHRSFNLSDKFHAAIYAIDTSEIACPREMRHIYHRLVTYDPTGKIIDSKVVAWQSGEELMIMKMDHNKISMTEYNRVWKKPYKKTDFDNDIVKTTKGNERSYEINPEGKIVEASVGAIP